MNKIRQKPVLAFVGILIIGCVVLATSLSAHAIADQLHSWKLLPEPERLTELYFTQKMNLPTTYKPGDAEAVTFTVHNLEYRTTTYHYTITEQSEDGSQTTSLKTGSFTLNQNQYKSIAEYVHVTDLGSRAKVTVELTNTNESIDYWVNREG